MSDTPTDRPFRWYATEKIARLEAEIEDLKDDKRVFLSHLSLLADLLTPDQAAKARKLLDVTPRMEFLSKTLALQQENAALRDALQPFVKYGTEHGVSDLIGRNGAVIRKSDWLSAIDAARKEAKS